MVQQVSLLSRAFASALVLVIDIGKLTHKVAEALTK